MAVGAAASDITLTVGDETFLARTLAAWTVDSGRSRPRNNLKLEIEVETGLGRGGLVLDALPSAVRAIRSAPGVELVGVWSHLGSPHDPRRSADQVQSFERAQRAMGGEGVVVRSWHLAASGGLLADAARPYGAVRPGLAMYGVLPDDLPIAEGRSGLAAALRPVMSLRARPVRVVTLPAGSEISYGSTFVTTRRSRIATLPVGYADGYQRSRTNRIEALVRGTRVPLVGTIAMDAVMADVTEVAGSPVTVDDEFVLMGEQGDRTLTAAELARSGTTISWEVLAGMSRRVPRVYYAAARTVGVRTLTEERGQWQNARERDVGEGRRQP
jgi:alanine racemase